MNLRGFILLMVFAGLCVGTGSAQAAAAPRGAVLVEAEAFADYGGWVDDSQFMDQLGSPFLLAHGLGVPVRDATTQVTLPGAGKYRVWVRTRDWVAPWKAPGAPGRFLVSIDGQPLSATFGMEGAEWHWQDGGVADAQRKEATLALHDLTGFDGRCDAILLAPDGGPAFVPPNERKPLDALRKALLKLPAEPEDAGQFDLVVVGGGIAGTCAAVSAARHNLRVALIQDRPVLGGNNSSEVRVWLQGARNLAPYPHIGDIVAELEQARHAHYGPDNTAELYEDDKKLELVRAEKNITLRLLHRANAVEMDGQRIAAVIAQHTRTGRKVRFRARLFADCTGDGCLGYLAGADCEMTVPGHMGRCNLWNAADTGEPQAFPRCPWALDLTQEPFPGRQQKRLESLGGWYWESGFDHDPFAKSESIRDWNFRAAYGAWDALKNVDCAFPNHRLNWVAYVSGKRESRRIMGEVVLTKDDLLSGKVYDDGCVPTGWKIDVHVPDPLYDRAFRGDAFIAKALFTDYKKPYWIPYRCLYSRSVANLFMAGRDISVTHEALGATRVMRTGGCMGEVVGIAASICVEKDATPRGVYHEHLALLKQLMRQPKYARVAGQLPRALEGKVGENVALEADIRVSGTHAEYSPACINDGIAAPASNFQRWVSPPEPNSWVEFKLPRPREVTAWRIVSGYLSAGQTRPSAPLEDFVLQYRDGDAWRDIEATQTRGNTRCDYGRTFAPVQAARFRLSIAKTPSDFARIWEVQLFTKPKN